MRAFKYVYVCAYTWVCACVPEYLRVWECAVCAYTWVCASGCGCVRMLAVYVGVRVFKYIYACAYVSLGLCADVSSMWMCTTYTVHYTSYSVQCTRMCLSIWVSGECVFVSVCICASVRIRACESKHVCMYLDVCACMYACTYLQYRWYNAILVDSFIN